MQHRRVPADDNKGVNEYLNERDSDGNGIRVPASYYVSLGSVENGSDQRRVQAKIDDPLQYMFTQDIDVIDGEFSQNDDFDFPTALKEAGIVDTVKMITTPLAKGKFLLRLSNLADVADADAETKKVNKTQVIEAMWKEGNKNNAQAEMNQFTVVETSITGNIKMEDMRSRRLQWETVDDDILVKKDLDFKN